MSRFISRIKSHMNQKPSIILKGGTVEILLGEDSTLIINGREIDQSKIGSIAKEPRPEPNQQDLVPQSLPAQAQQIEPSAHTFAEKFEALRLQVPRIGLQCVNNENSPFCQYTENSKNSYMVFASFNDEDCMYDTRVLYCTDCVDCAFCTKCELCYECVDCKNCYSCTQCVLCEQAIDCSYCYQCTGTQNCFGCVGLQKSAFCIFNKQYTKEAYLEKLKEVQKLSPGEIAQQMEPLLTSVPGVATYGRNNENSTGNNIFNCKNVETGFDSNDLFDCTHVYHCNDARDLLDCSNLSKSELCYGIMSGGGLNNCNFCFGCFDSSNLEYCELVYNSHDCFGCVGINRAEYRIFNKQYTKDEYFIKVQEIKEAMKRDGSYGKMIETTYPEVLTYGRP